jgi:putative tricarboxylic transport membrane protein
VSGGSTGSVRRVDRAALVIAAGMFILAAIVGWDAAHLGNVATYARIGPQTVPYVIALCLAGLGVWTLIEAWRGDIPVPEPQQARPVLWIVAGLLIQLLLLRIAGFSIATGAMFGLVATGLGRKALWITVPIGVVLAFIVWVIFTFALALSLPAGPLETAVVELVRGFG